MKKAILIALLCMAFSVPVSAQTVSADRFRLNTGPCVISSGSGAPEGVRTGNVCDEYYQTDSPYAHYRKTSGTGNTGWSILPFWTTVTANHGLFGPTSGSAALPTFRALVLADLPTASANTVLTGTGSTSAYSATPTVTSITATTSLISPLWIPAGGTATITAALYGKVGATMYLEGGLTGGDGYLQVTHGNPRLYLSDLMLRRSSAVGLRMGNSFGVDLTFEVADQLWVKSFAGTDAATVKGFTHYATGGFVGVSGTLTASAPGYSLTQTWNNAAVAFKGSRLVFTETAADSAARYLEILGGASGSTDEFYVQKGGTAAFAGNVNPIINYTSNLGALTNKYLTIHGAELWVETLVAQSTMATIGGRVLVAPTNVLSADLAPAGTTITVKYNNFINGDRIYMESNGKLEFMAVASAAGGSAGVYTYTVTRDLDGSGANQWYAGDAALDTGTTGNGFIDLYSTAGVLSGSGPTIVGNVRTGTAYNAIAPRWAIGNLNGLYGYGADTYGAAFGDNSNAWVKIDPTNGVRIGHNAPTKVQIDASGNATFTGTVTAAAGAIGGWTIGADYVRDTAGVVGMSSAVTGGDDIRFFAGNVTPSSAPFRVTEAGALTATSATITGAITASTGSVGSFTIGTYLNSGSKATYNDNVAGVHIGSDGIGLGSAFTVSAAGALAATSGTIATWSITTSGLIYDTGTDATSAGVNPSSYPFYAGATFANRASAPFRVTPAGALVATSATITGAITASTGSIGSFTIGTYLNSGSKATYNDGVAGVHIGSDGIGLGSTFTVSAAGALTATGATISGAITATSGSFTGAITASSGSITGALTIGTGGSLASGATAYGTGTGIWMAYNGGTPQFRVGNPAGQRIEWDGTNANIYGANWELSESYGLHFSDASGMGDYSNQISWGSRGTVGAHSSATYVCAPSASWCGDYHVNVDTAGMFVVNNLTYKFSVEDTLTTIYTATEFRGHAMPNADNSFKLGDSGVKWSEGHVNNLFVYNELKWNSPPTTTSADYPLVYSTGNTIVYRKTNGYNTSSGCGGGGAWVSDVTAENGIVTSVSCSSAPITELVQLRREVDELKAQVAALLGVKR